MNTRLSRSLSESEEEARPRPAPACRVFFGELEVSGAQDLFRRFNVGQLPYVFRLAPSLSLAGSGNVKLPADDVLKVEHVGHYPFLAGDFANFVRGWYRAAPVSLLQNFPFCPGEVQDHAGSQEVGQTARAMLPISDKWFAVCPLHADLSSC